jgi:hypothetical protein
MPCPRRVGQHLGVTASVDAGAHSGNVCRPRVSGPAKESSQDDMIGWCVGGAQDDSPRRIADTEHDGSDGLERAGSDAATPVWSSRAAGEGGASLARTVTGSSVGILAACADDTSTSATTGGTASLSGDPSPFLSQLRPEALMLQVPHTAWGASAGAAGSDGHQRKQQHRSSVPAGKDDPIFASGHWLPRELFDN